jgi:hypothetical protein
VRRNADSLHTEIMRSGIDSRSSLLHPDPACEGPPGSDSPPNLDQKTGRDE